MKSDAAIFALVVNTGREPFEWGRHDCAMLAFDAVQAVTGRDPAQDLRGAYSTAEEARKLLDGMGGLLGLCAKRFGPRIQAAAMQTGDVALLSQSLCQGVTAEHGALGVWWRGLILARAEAGIVYLPVSSVLRAWRAA